MTDTTSTTASPTAALSAAGVSIWLDDLSRERIATGGLQKLIAEKNVVGVTTNPTIFAAALSKGEAYADQVKSLAAASDIFHDVYEQTEGTDGRVSIEVEPGLAHDAAGTIEQAKKLAAKVD